MAKKIIIILIPIMLIIGIIVFTRQGVGSAGISKEEFDKISIGSTTMWGIGKIIDPEDKWSDDEVYNKVVTEIEDSQKDNVYKHVYKYLGEKRRLCINYF